MGKETRLRSKQFFDEHPLCAFCGGAAKATTKEHCPPRAVFQNREWPEGFEFPSCEPCNQGTADHDVLAALLARLDPIQNQGDRDGRLTGLLRNAHHQHPGFVEQMMSMGSNESRRSLRQLGIQRPKGLTYRETGIVRVTEHMDRTVQALAKKLSKAIFYRETGQIFPSHGAIQFHWFTNADLFEFGSVPVLDALTAVKAIPLRIERNKQSLTAQFDCRYSITEGRELALLQAVFGNAFGFVTIASPVAGKLQDIEKEMIVKTGIGQGPFRFI